LLTFWANPFIFIVLLYNKKINSNSNKLYDYLRILWLEYKLIEY